MKFISKPAVTAGLTALAFGSLAASPAQAQVNGIAVVDPTGALVLSRSRDTAFQQVTQTFQSQIQLIGTLDNEIGTLQTSLDTNGDKNLTQEEVDANPNVVQQIQAKQQQIQLATQPIEFAHMYVLEQLLRDFDNSMTAVMTATGTTVILGPDAVMRAPAEMQLTDELAAELDKRQPTLVTTVPAGWQPTQVLASTYEQVQQMLMALAAQAARARAAQQPGGAANGAAAPAPPTEGGR